MSQKKPFNRSPNICPAGKHIKSTGTVQECMKQYCLQDHVDALKNEAKVNDRESFTYKLLPTKNYRHIGIFTESRPLMRPSVKSRYREVVDDFKETGCQKYWTHNVGKARDATGNLPAGYNVYTETCGIKSQTEDAGLIINPRKSYGQVFDEYVKGHDLYLKSHNSYWTNERIDRKYKPPFNKNNEFGLRSIADIRGCFTKECVTNKSAEKFTAVCDVQADFQEKNYSKLGTSHGIKNHLPEDHAYGLSTKYSVGMRDIFAQASYPEIKKEVDSYTCFLTPLRLNLKKRVNRRLLFFDDVFMTFKYYDKNDTGWLPLKDCYEVCSCYKITFEKPIMERYLRRVKILQDDKINYKQFMTVINMRHDLPKIGDIYHVKPSNMYYETTSRAMAEDYKYIDNSKCRAAGVSSIRHDLPLPKVPNGGCTADLTSLGGETSTGILISPTVYTSYGLSYADFLIPRKKDEIRRIFTMIGYLFDEDEFEKFWEEGLKIDKTGELVCVDTFKNLLEKHNCFFMSDD